MTSSSLASMLSLCAPSSVAAGLVALALALANAKQFCADLLAPCYLMDYPESFAEMFCDR